MAKTGYNGLHYFGVMVWYLLTITWLIFHNGFTPLLLAMAVFFAGRLMMRRLTGYTSSRIKILKSSFLIFSFIAIGTFFTLARSETNYAYFLDSSNSLEVLSDDQWISIENALKIDVTEAYKGATASHQTLRIRRRQPAVWGKALVNLVPEVIHIFTFNPNNEFYLLAEVNEGFKPMNVTEANERKTSNFIINSSFYDPKNHVLGEVIYLGKRYQRKTQSSGYFKVINGVPHAGPSSIFQNIPGNPTYSCQAHPATLKNGALFFYIEEESIKALWNQKTYRNLVGERKDGRIVVIVSGNGGLLDVKEITQIAQRLGVNHASLFDAGSALQYRFTDGSYTMSFSACNNEYDLGDMADRITMKLFHKKLMQRSPLFIGVKFLS